MNSDRSRPTSRAPVAGILLYAVAALAAAGITTGREDATPWRHAPKGGIRGRLVFERARPAREVVVYLERLGDPLAFAVPEPLRVRQRGARFDPPFSVVVTGREVVFLNDEEEAIDHNVYFLGAENVDLGIFPRGEQVSHVLAEPGEVSVHCSVHKFMDGKILIVPTPAFAILPGDRDTFEIPDVPTGTYRLRTFQRARRFREADEEIIVRAGETTEVEIGMTR